MSAGGLRRGRVKRGICKRPEDWQRSSFRHYATGCSTQATTGLEWATKHEAVILSEAKDPGAAGRLSGSVEAFVLRRIRASGECLETFSKLLALQGSFASLRMTSGFAGKRFAGGEDEGSFVIRGLRVRLPPRLRRVAQG